MITYRPLNVPAENGSRLIVDKGCATIEIRDSKSLPISVIDTGKVLVLAPYYCSSIKLFLFFAFSTYLSFLNN